MPAQPTAQIEPQPQTPMTAAPPIAASPPASEPTPFATDQVIGAFGFWPEQH